MGTGRVSWRKRHPARHAKNKRGTLMLLCYLQRAQLQQLRVAFNHRSRVREVAQRSRLAARAFESREPFLSRLDDLREELFQFARERQIADGHLLEHEAKALRGRLTLRKNLRTDLAAVGEECFDVGRRDRRAEGLLQ